MQFPKPPFAILTSLVIFISCTSNPSLQETECLKNHGYYDTDFVTGEKNCYYPNPPENTSQ